MRQILVGLETAYYVRDGGQLWALKRDVVAEVWATNPVAAVGRDIPTQCLVALSSLICPYHHGTEPSSISSIGRSQLYVKKYSRSIQSHKQLGLKKRAHCVPLISPPYSSGQ